MCTQVGSNPFREIPLLGNYSPCLGILFQVQGAIGKAALIRGRSEKKARLWLCYLFVKHVLELENFNICLY